MKIRFHKVAALVVLAVSVAWVATGEFSSVGSAQDADAGKPAAAAEQAKPPVRTVAVVEPPRVSHARAIRVSGQTEADKRAELATRAAGIIAELPVTEGQRVKSGDVILVLDAEEKQAAVEMGRQLLIQREAEAEAAERLTKSGSMAKLQADQARSALAAARSQLEAATAELSRLEVRAPFDGVVDRVLVEQGSMVAQGAPVATILHLDPIIASGEVSERDLGYLETGDEADVRLVNGDVVTGEVRYISRDATDQTRTFRVEVAVSNPQYAIPAGMTAEITLRAEPVDAVMLPRSVVTLGADGELGIRTVDAKRKVTFYPIDLVDDTPKGLVLAGIPKEARVIVSGQDLVKEGDVVNAIEADAAAIRKLVGEATASAR
jgi:membrane fusion protein, multidrug efflux system